MQNRVLAFVKRMRYTLIFLLLYFLWVWLRPEPAPQIYQLTGVTMGTQYQILISGFPDSVPDNELAAGIEQRLLRIDRELMSTYAPESELSRFNRSEPGEWFDVSPELAYVGEQARYSSKVTDGYFDVTVGPLVNRWGFGPLTGQRVDQARIPGDDEIRALQARTGYQHLQARLSPPQLRKQTDVYVDLSAIAKGYAVDVIAEYFDSLMMASYFIEIGGELRLKGFRPDGTAWVPAIERPVATGEPQVQQIIYSRGQSIAVAGSGDYRNYFEQDGVRYSHEIDPFSGRPVTHALAAVTVLAATATEADAMATAFMVMGEEKSMALASRLGMAVYLIIKQADGDGFAERFTPEFAGYMEE